MTADNKTVRYTIRSKNEHTITNIHEISDLIQSFFREQPQFCRFGTKVKYPEYNTSAWVRIAFCESESPELYIKAPENRILQIRQRIEDTLLKGEDYAIQEKEGVMLWEAIEPVYCLLDILRKRSMISSDSTDSTQTPAAATGSIN